MSDEGQVPDWTFGLDKVTASKEEPMVKIAASRVRELKVALSEDRLVVEKDSIERLAAEHSTYYYSNKWEDEQVAELKEYARVCGLDMAQFVETDPESLVIEEDEQEKVTVASADSLVKTASAEPQRLDIGDPFGLESVEDRAAPEKWQEVKAESKLGKPSMMTNSIRSIGGGEDYLKNSDVPLASNQNSIANPKAIEEFASSEVEDTGARLAREAKEREDAKAQHHDEWQQKVVESMPDYKETIKGTVFPTEVMNAQSGLSNPSSQQGVYAKFDPDSIPEKTVGETLADQNEARRQSIQGTDKEDHEFTMSSQSARGISDTFADSLKASLNK
jgi:hypothetical protein